ncbi:MAG: TetR/AcrR family transcriptional regulator [Proteobacteria bacterium]|nr:TetR/AcrR family transcriptional regulator [Pseudomonadota bacterium]
MTSAPKPRERRRRLAPEVRREQIIKAAGRLILQQRHLPLKLDHLAQATGVSKALIYAYFPTQYDLFNAVLDQEFQVLAAQGMEAASAGNDLETAATDCALAYFDHVAAAGPLIHLILRDPYLSGRLAPGPARFRDRIVGRLARLARRELKLPAKETIAAINMAITIPEEAGRLVYAGELPLARGRELCSELIASSVAAFKPRQG